MWAGSLLSGGVLLRVLLRFISSQNILTLLSRGCFFFFWGGGGVAAMGILPQCIS